MQWHPLRALRRPNPRHGNAPSKSISIRCRVQNSSLAHYTRLRRDSPTPYLPRARYCIFRGFWAELPENEHNSAPKNPRVYETDLPAFTTDVRMHKPYDLFSSSAGHADRESLVQGSGGGGPCEAVWWVKDVMTQWRVKGTAFIVAPDIEGSGEESSGVRTVKSEIGGRMRVVDEGKKEEWSWEKELTGHFGNMSPGMRSKPNACCL